MSVLSSTKIPYFKKFSTTKRRIAASYRSKGRFGCQRWVKAWKVETVLGTGLGGLSKESPLSKASGHEVFAESQADLDSQ